MVQTCYLVPAMGGFRSMQLMKSLSTYAAAGILYGGNGHPGLQGGEIAPDFRGKQCQLDGPWMESLYVAEKALRSVVRCRPV